jgi:hypothetical protein
MAANELDEFVLIIASEAVRIKKLPGCLESIEVFSSRTHNLTLRVESKFDCLALVLIFAIANEVIKANGVEQAAGHPGNISLPCMR